MEGACTHTAIDECRPCVTAADCPAAGACDEAVCTAGRCEQQPIPSCVSCTDDTMCSDGNGCTAEHCELGTCQRREIPDCVPCATAAECDDQRVCTDDVCTPEGTCDHEEIAGCVPCASDTDCEDRNACTAQGCAPEGSCKITAVPGCTACDGTEGCDDGDECTTDTCTEGVCRHVEIEDCGPCVAMAEVCGDAMDNDCDDLVDCDDPNCDSAPRCRPEICGDCLDNDGDGQTDYEDRECCARGITLRAASLKFKAQTRRPWQRLQFKTVFGPVPPASLDPMSGDTSLQIADANGQLFCTTIESQYWSRMGQRGYAFRKRLAGPPAGIAIGRLRLDRRGTALFETQAWMRPLSREPGDDIHATLRVGGLCVRIVTDDSGGRGSRGRGQDDDGDDDRDDDDDDGDDDDDDDDDGRGRRSRGDD
jgi:hypothetical protein